MRNYFRNLSVRNKLLLIMLCTSGMALFIATVGIMYNETQFHEQAKRQDIQITAQMISYNIGASLAFDDRDSAYELLASLRSDNDILSARLFDRQGELFASYIKQGLERDQSQQEAVFEVSTPVWVGEAELGRLRFQVGEAGVHEAIQENLGVILSLAFLSFVISLLLALWMQRFISGPIVEVTNKMSKVTNNKDYSLRLDWHSDDELGHLAQAFNTMLTQVELRDGQLASNQELLENTVEERTHQLIASIAKLQKAENSLNHIMQAMGQTGEAVLILGVRGEVEYFNPACMTLTGFSLQELKQAPFSMLCDDIYEKIWPKVLLGDIWKEELACIKKSGERFHCLLSMSPISADTDEVTQVVIIFRDLSDREELEAQLRQSQKMESVGVLVGGIAHDFNNLLAGIVGNLELAKIDIENPQVVRNWLDKIESISFRAAETIAKLLAFARKSTVQMEAIQLVEFVNEVEHLARIGISETVELHFEAGPENLWVQADSHQLQQVLLNLLNNAVDAVQMFDPHKIPVVTLSIDKIVPDITLRNRFPELCNEHYAIIRVKDNGGGIPQEHLSKVFDPFFTTKPEGKGTGLGLSMAYGMAQRHGGAMYVESTVGQGAEFMMLLPILEPPAVILPKTQPQMPEALRGFGELVLLADDEALVRDYTSSILKRLGYSVLVAEDGIEVVELFKKHQAEIKMVILDLVMPGQGGAQAAKQIQQMSANMPIMFVSGYDLKSSMQEFDGLQEYKMLQKPYRVHELGGALREHLDRQLL